jgi:hypothetical protein
MRAFGGVRIGRESFDPELLGELRAALAPRAGDENM